ncbi:HTH-type transcriptional repressor CytR [Pigmentiphaga humi]|uniref:HTH-type transcriptional repressor CytR n=1 Tax=Pigmentiphaga humi TaxID=2478468 RepID=A0A3P4B1E6_9BURK|nr:LacI family DNA-binding transcriptional regulator [Pigmentiphaga humi]VCU69691.1 HTH-type transcriptional repressor CytR [Pigmentiphaga humi]
MPKRSPAATLDDIALHAQVHKTTASRALDPARRHMISPEVVRRVEAAARALNYRVNRAASALRTGRSGTVGVLLPDITNPVFPPILRGIEQALAAEGFFVMVADTGHEQSPDEAADRMLAQRVEGLIVATSSLRDPLVRRLSQDQAKVVLVNRRDEDGLLPSVVSDDILGMKLAVDHLVAQGHRRIAHLSGPLGLSTGALRKAGFEQALAAHGLQAAGHAECTAYSFEAGEDGARRLLDAGASFSAVVAANDLLALGAIQALQAQGRCVPDDVSVVGHNDMPLMDRVFPALTTVRILHYEMGYRAARLLLDSLRGVPGTTSTVVLRPELVVRGSSAPPA